MKIRTRLSLIIYISSAMMLLVICFLAWSISAASKTDRLLDLLEKTEKVIFKRSLLRSEFMLNHEERALIQYRIKTEELKNLSKLISDRLATASESNLIEDVNDNIKTSIAIFSKIIELKEDDRGIETNKIANEELKTRLYSHLLLKSYELKDNISRFISIIKNKTKIKNEMVLYAIIFLVIAAIASTMTNTLFIRNLIKHRLEKLLKGIYIIGSGNLDYRISITGNDELSDLERLTNEMAAKLSLSLTSIERLEKEVVERQLAEEEVRTAAYKWRLTFDSISDAVCLIDSQYRILRCNQAMANLVGRPFNEITGSTCWNLVHGTSGPIDGCPMVRMQESRKRETMTVPLGDRWLHVKVDPMLNEAGELIGGVHIIADITDYKRAEEKIRNLNTLLQAIKEINESLLRVKSEPELFKKTCNLLLKMPNMQFNWIGLIDPDNKGINPVAWAGAEDGYLDTVKVKWVDCEHGSGPAFEALKTGKPYIRHCIESDPEPNPWRQEALHRGYKSSITLPLIHEGEVIGVLKGYAGIAHAFGDEEVEFLTQVAGDIAVGIKSLRLEQEGIQRLIQLEVMMIQIVEALASMTELRDPYTAGHQQRVTRLALALAREMGLTEDRLNGLRVAGLTHDVGKIVVPAEILSKPGKIGEFEMSLIRAHAQAGYDILKKIDFLWPVAQIVLQHHERLNGSGYPQGLQGPDILAEAKIMAVADVVEAMASHRPYRPALGIDKALEEVTAHKGVLYDPEVVDICIRLFREKGFSFD